MALAVERGEADKQARLEKDWSRIVRVVEQLNSGSHWMDFYLHLHGRYQVAERYAAHMTTDARERYAQQLQLEGMRAMEQDMIDGAADSVVGVYLEAARSVRRDAETVRAQAARLINNAIALYGDEDDFGDVRA